MQSDSNQIDDFLNINDDTFDEEFPDNFHDFMDDKYPSDEIDKIQPNCDFDPINELNRPETNHKDLMGPLSLEEFRNRLRYQKHVLFKGVNNPKYTGSSASGYPILP